MFLSRNLNELWKRSVAVAVLTVAVCVATPAKAELDEAYEGYEDPLEGWNRGVYAFNEFVDSILLEPLARGYKAVMPARAERGVSNAIRNLGEPVNMLNSLLQGDVEQGLNSFWRFILNTTLGVGGLFDFAAHNSSLVYRDEDFGQTLGVWGVGSGPYVVLPILGPSSVRDTGGFVVDMVSDPWNYMLEWDGIAIRAGVTAIDRRASMLTVTDEIDMNSLDPYATMRGYYLQYRENQVRNGDGSGRSGNLMGDSAPVRLRD